MNYLDAKKYVEDALFDLNDNYLVLKKSLVDYVEGNITSDDVILIQSVLGYDIGYFNVLETEEDRKEYSKRVLGTPKVKQNENSIKQIREEFKKSKEEVSQFLGITEEEYEILEGFGNNTIPDIMIHKLSFYLHCSPIELLSWSNIRYKPVTDNDSYKLILMIAERIKDEEIRNKIMDTVNYALQDPDEDDYDEDD